MTRRTEYRGDFPARHPGSTDISSGQIDAYMRRARQSVRLTEMFGEFSRLATGQKGVPDSPVTLSPDLLQHDALCLEYAEVRARHSGVFNQHFVASLPYVLEEQCRFGAGIVRYGRLLRERKSRPMDVYSLGDASGVTARSLTEISGGQIRTLTCSPNPENETVFRRCSPGADAYFYLGPFFEVTANALRQKGIRAFDGGFDLIIEDTTFQMYGRERLEPICLAARNLRADGIFIFLEKFMHEKRDEFIKRERQKDKDFKLRYFAPKDIEDKKRIVISKMDQQLVTLHEMTSTLGELFSHAVVIWNSGNFYTIAASNDGGNLAALVNSLIYPAIPAEFLYAKLPSRILGEFESPLEFRQARGT